MNLDLVGYNNLRNKNAYNVGCIVLKSVLDSLPSLIYLHVAC